MSLCIYRGEVGDLLASHHESRTSDTVMAFGTLC